LAAPIEDQRIDIEGGKIVRIQSAGLRNAYPPGSRVLDLTDRTVIPGLVGMHDRNYLLPRPNSRSPEDTPPVYWNGTPERRVDLH